MKQYFELIESQAAPHKFFISVVHENVDKFFAPPYNCSFGVLPARLVNLRWTDYLRFCRDVLGATLVGKNNLYVVPYFDKTPEVQMFVRLLNKTLKYIESEYDNPVEYIQEGGRIKTITFNMEEE